MLSHLVRAHLATALCAVVIAGCSRGTHVTTIPGITGKAVGRTVPDWYVNPPRDDKTVVATGSATSADMQLALTKAQTVARATLAEQVQATYSILTRQFAEEVGRDSTGQLLEQFTRTVQGTVRETLVNTAPGRQYLQEEPAGYRAFVLVSVDKGDVAARLLREIKANEALYTRLRATQAFKDLERALAAPTVP